MKSILFLLLFSVILGGCVFKKLDDEYSKPKSESTENTDTSPLASSADSGSEKSITETTFATDVDGLPFLKTTETEVVSLKNGDSFEMTAGFFQQKMGKTSVRRLAYNGQIPGPVLRIEKGATITLKLINKTGIPTDLRLHGVLGGNDSALIQNGDSLEYTLSFPDAGVFWYHPLERQDFAQEMGLYGNIIVTEDGYWNTAKKEEYIFVDDFSINDPFYRKKTNKTLEGRFGNIFLIDNTIDFQKVVNQGEVVRYYLTNAANARSFDISFLRDRAASGEEYKKRERRYVPQKLKIVGGDNGRIEREYFTQHINVAPGERVVFEVLFEKAGIYEIQYDGKKIGKVTAKEKAGASKGTGFSVLRKNIADYKSIRNQLHSFIKRNANKKLVITLALNDSDLASSLKNVKKDTARGQQKIKEENAAINKKMDNTTMKWILRDVYTGKENKDIDWKFTKGDQIKIEIFNDPKSLFPVPHTLSFTGQRFLVLSRDGVPTNNLQWKDTVSLEVGERVEILLEATRSGVWSLSSSVVEHAQDGMTMFFSVL